MWAQGNAGLSCAQLTALNRLQHALVRFGATSSDLVFGGGINGSPRSRIT
jgi:hypothetical protein